MIRAIFFDAAGTLFYLPKSVGEHYAAVARDMGVRFSSDALDRAFLSAWKNAPNRSSIDHPRDEDDKRWWQELVAVVLAATPNVPADFDRDRFFELAYRHFTEPGVWALYSDVTDVLTALRSKFHLGVISNFDRRLHVILQQLGIAAFFGHVFTSSELGADKPDPEIYRRALKRSGLTGNETLHVGDNPSGDWQAAAQAGMQVFKLDRPENSLRNLPSFIEQQDLACMQQRQGSSQTPSVANSPA
jgi:putative hydrolase of the HAD superfamily